MAVQPNTLIFETKERLAGVGRIANMAIDLDFTFRKDEEAEGTNRPPYRVFGLSPRGAQVEIGAIWSRVSKQTGNPYLALQLTDTGCPQAPTFQGNIGRKQGGSDDDLEQAIYPTRL